jgi:hypothetical protein
MSLRALVELLDEAGNRAVGQAFCMPNDNFDRSLGVIIALGRARKDMEHELLDFVPDWLGS